MSDCDTDLAPLSTLPYPPLSPDWFGFAARLVLDHAAALKAAPAKVVRIDERRKP